MIPIPDGDIFGEDMDGTWQPAADLVEQEQPIEEVEHAMLTCLRRWEKRNLPEGQAMALPFAQVLASFNAQADSAAQRSALLDRLQGMAAQSYGHRLLSVVAGKLLANPYSWYGMSLHFIACTVYRETLYEAVRRGFIKPLTVGAAKRQIWSHDKISHWEAHLGASVEKVVARVEPGQRLSLRGTGRRTGKTPSATADMISLALPVKGR